MSLRVVGAGLGRTGTHSLKLALEQLLGAPCYHMLGVFQRPDHVEPWRLAAEGDMPNWTAMFDGFDAAVDWPAASFWREISDSYPDALILLSVRDPDAWWTSASNTIFEAMQRPPEDESAQLWHDMVVTMFRVRFTDDITNPDAAKAAYVRHNDDVRRTAPKDRLLEWHPGDGWAPICGALGLPLPEAPFPHVNTTDEFRAMLGLEATG
jgi:hypothetical protein